MTAPNGNEGKPQEAFTADEPPSYDTIHASPSSGEAPDTNCLTSNQRSRVLQIRQWMRTQWTTVAAGPLTESTNGWRYDADWSEPCATKAYPGLWGVWPAGPPHPEQCRCMTCRAREGWGRMKGLVYHRWAPVRPSGNADSAFQSPMIIHGFGLRPRELEQVVHPSRDWTRSWAWAITLRVYSHPDDLPACQWYFNVRILVKNLQGQLKSPEITWGDEQKWADLEQMVSTKSSSYQDEYWWQCHAFSTPEALEAKPLNTRSWIAEVAMRHKDREWLRGHDFRELFSAENIVGAEIDERTRPGRCKKVVLYHRGLAYGNDMTGQLVEAWKPELPEKFGAFIRPLLPRSLNAHPKSRE